MKKVAIFFIIIINIKEEYAVDIKVCTNISSEYKNIEICINAPEKNE